MEQIKKFLRGKGFALALLACLLAAAAAGVWAVRTVRAELAKNWTDLTRPDSTQTQPEPQEDWTTQEDDDLWQQEPSPAAASKPDVPQPASSVPSASSGARSGSGSVSEPSALHTESSSAASSAAPAAAQPVAGRVLNAYSGDELVYNKTLGDWRTHNGVDYACEPDALVTSPAAGTVMQTGQDGSWGSVVSIEDSAGRIWRVCGVTGLDVAEGDMVSVGQQLGKAGTVSCECAEDSHIHLEVKQGNQYLDPAKVMD